MSAPLGRERVVTLLSHAMGRVAAGIALAGLFLVGMYFATLREAQVTCEVCIDFNGKSACRTASGEDETRALYAARNMACAILSAGVTSGMSCGRVEPTRKACSD